MDAIKELTIIEDTRGEVTRVSCGDVRCALPAESTQWAMKLIYLFAAVFRFKVERTGGSCDVGMKTTRLELTGSPGFEDQCLLDLGIKHSQVVSQLEDMQLLHASLNQENKELIDEVKKLSDQLAHERKAHGVDARKLDRVRQRSLVERLGVALCGEGI